MAPTATRDWIWAGSLLVVSAVVPFAGLQSYLASASLVVAVGADVAFAAAMVIFALGPHSVVARRPLGATALLVLAASAFVPYVGYLLPARTAMAPDADMIFWGTALNYGQLALALAAAIVAGIQVARAGVVPQGLRGTPLIALAVVATPPVLLQLVAVATGGAPSGPLIALSALSSITSFVAVAGLGVVAIIAGLPPRTVPDASVPVFSSDPPPHA